MFKKKISLIGYGTWGLGGDSYGYISQSKTQNLLNYALKKGINFFDTSNIYGRGLSEKRIGLFLKKNINIRSKIFIATKCGMKNHSPSSWNVPQNFNISFLKRSIDESLKRLNTNYIDLIQLHSPPIKLLKNKKKIIKILNFLIKLKNKKKIVNFGVSVKSPADAIYILQNYKKFKFIQLNFNLMDQRAIDCGVLDLAYKKKVYVISRTPYAFGYLVNNVKFKKLDHRKKWSNKQIAIWNKGRLSFLKIIKRKNLKSASLALLFATYHPSIITVIPGMMSIYEINQALEFLKLKKLSKKEIKNLRNYYNSIDWIYYEKK